MERTHNFLKIPKFCQNQTAAKWEESTPRTIQPFHCLCKSYVWGQLPGPEWFTLRAGGWVVQTPLQSVWPDWRCVRFCMSALMDLLGRGTKGTTAGQTCSQEFLCRIKNEIGFLLQQNKKPGGEENHLFSKCNARAANEAPTYFHWRRQQGRDDTDVSSCHAKFLETVCHLILVWFVFLSFLCPLNWPSMRADVELGK